MWMLAWVPKTQSPVLGVPIADDRALFRGRMMVTLRNIVTGQVVVTCAIEAIIMLQEGGWQIVRK